MIVARRWQWRRGEAYLAEDTTLGREVAIEALLSEPEFRRELEAEDQRKWETFTLRLLAWDGESEELPEAGVWVMSLSRRRCAES